MSSESPNVLFIGIDDLNDWTGALGGHPQALTPNLDRLAASGILFENAHCPAPICNPSRTALLTGIRPSTSGVYRSSQPWRWSPALRDAYTLPQWFMNHGYRVKGSGKIFHDLFPDPESWHDYWPSFRDTVPASPMPLSSMPNNGIPGADQFDWGAIDVPDEEMGDWKVADWVIGELMDPEPKQPFFLACGFSRPHLPWFVPRKYIDAFPLETIEIPEVPDDDLGDVPEAGKSWAGHGQDHKKVLDHDQWQKAIQAYLASILFVDTCVGRVVDALDRSEYRDNTIVVLWSDHGWHLGEKHHWRKFTLWEESTRVQMMWRVPGLTSGGGRCRSPVNLVDIYPTLLELGGLPSNEALEGVSLVPLLQSPENGARAGDRPSLTTHGPGNHSLRDHRFRYIRYADGCEELYDHENDPGEWNNLAADETFYETKKQLIQYLPDSDAEESVGLPFGKNGVT